MAYGFNTDLISTRAPVTIGFPNSMASVIHGNVAGVFSGTIVVEYVQRGRRLIFLLRAEDVSVGAVSFRWVDPYGVTRIYSDDDSELIQGDSGGSGGGGGGSLTVPDNYFFSTDVERDTFFASNPGDLVEGVYCVVDGVLQQYQRGAWIDVTAILQGPAGPPGAPGATGAAGPPGEVDPSLQDAVTTLQNNLSAEITAREQAISDKQTQIDTINSELVETNRVLSTVHTSSSDTLLSTTISQDTYVLYTDLGNQTALNFSAGQSIIRDNAGTLAVVVGTDDNGVTARTITTSGSGSSGTAEGVPPGGLPGESLRKVTAADYDTEWRGGMFTYTQTPAATQWNVQHNKGMIPTDVLTLDSSGDQIVGFIDYAASTTNLLVIRFSEALAGSAHFIY